MIDASPSIKKMSSDGLPPPLIPSIQVTYRQRKVFVTGHTGFKGSWLALWLHQLGARVTGYALPPTTTPNLFTLAEIEASLTHHHLADIREASYLKEALQASEAEIVFHLAAQPLVRASYRDPLTTWQTNVQGTVNVLDAVRHCPSVRAVVVITTDKCYENQEWPWGYRESDTLGGHDPYAASKAAAELVVQSYRRSFLEQQGVLVATARAGNVIGGGDWSEDRLIPDAVRALASGTPLVIRNPQATRPWQHVLEPLRGYLQLGAGLLAGHTPWARAFNFGPSMAGNRTVEQILCELKKHWPTLEWHVDAPSVTRHETNLLCLDSSLARQWLSWVPRWSLEEGITQTAQWCEAVTKSPNQARTACLETIASYEPITVSSP